MTKVVVVAGGGGVGKTTLAAAIAAQAASEGLPTLALTIDPARRLAGTLGVRLGARPTAVPGIEGLDAAMLDSTEAWEAIVRTHADAETAERLVANPFFRAIADRFPSGQAYAAAEETARQVESGRYRLVVVDTPPTPGGIDFLASPRQIRALVAGRALRWLTGSRLPGRRALYTITARPALRLADAVLGGPLLEDIADFLLDLRATYDSLSRRARAVEALFRSATIVVVTTADTAPVAEAVRFFRDLPRWVAPPHLLVFNRALPDTWVSSAEEGGDPLAVNLSRWGREAARQAEVRAEFAVHYGIAPIVVPWLAEVPSSAGDLAELAASCRLTTEALGLRSGRR